MTTSNGEFESGSNAALTAEQAAEAMRLAESGDTSVLGLDFGGGPTTAPEASTKSNEAATTTETKTAGADGGQASKTEPGAGDIPEDQQTADNTVVLARDGKHTIAFDKLQTARQQRDTATAELATAQAELATLRREAEARAAQGAAPTKMDNLTAKAEEAIAEGADPELFGDFSEGALKAGITKLVAQLVPQLAEKVVNEKLAPIQQREAQTEAESHESAIFSKFPNAVSIAESAEFAAWVQTQPKVSQGAIWATFDPVKGGTAAEIVDLLSAYTKATGAQADPPPAPGAQVPGAQAAVEPRREPPLSISGIPGARAGATLQDQMVDMGGQELSAAMENMTPAQIEAYLNKQL